MPALTPVRFNPCLRAYYERLVSRGEPRKLHSLRRCESGTQRFEASHATVARSFESGDMVLNTPSDAKALVTRGMKQRQLYANYPLRRAIRAFDKSYAPTCKLTDCNPR